MTYTWGEIQLAAIQKMFLNNVALEVGDLDELRDDKKYSTYLNAMPYVANEGLLRLMAKARPYFKTYSLTQSTINNLLGQTPNTYQHTTDDIEFEVTGGKSYYFEIDNKGTVEIYVNNVLFKTITNITRTPGVFTAYKGFITNPTDADVKIIFKGSNPYNFRYLAIYTYDYEYVTGNVESIPAFGPIVKYDLRALISDFYTIDSIYYEDGVNVPINQSEYTIQGDKILTIDINKIGNFTIYYQAYPQKITATTSDSTIIVGDPEVIILLPLYIASELYKDDDLSLAVSYRNQFEVGLENLYPANNQATFISTSGWL